VLEKRVPALQKLGATVRIKGGSPGVGNNWTLLIAQKSLLEVIEGINDEERQIEAIHKVLAAWCHALFEKELQAALKSIN
jgi:hypothetical protein